MERISAERQLFYEWISSGAKDRKWAGQAVVAFEPVRRSSHLKIYAFLESDF